MTKRALLTTAGVFAVVVLAGIALMTVVRDGDDGPAGGPKRTTTSSDDTDPGSGGTGSGGSGSGGTDGGEGSSPSSGSTPAPPEARDPEPIDPDVSGIDTSSSDAVATAWACAYWTHPRGETSEQMAQRLAPLSTLEMVAAISDLGMPYKGPETVSAVPGATEPGSGPDTYVVGCQTITTGADGTPAAPTAAHNTSVRVALTGEGWRVAEATVGGLTLPVP